MSLDCAGFSEMMRRVSSALARKGGPAHLVTATALLSEQARRPSDPRIGLLLDKNLPRLEPFFRKKGWWPLPTGTAPASELSDDEILQLIYKEIDLLAAELRQEAEQAGGANG